MEEWIGALWHRAITRAADRSHADAAVTLAEVQPLLGVLFRAAGGQATTRLAPAGETAVAGGRGTRGWLQRVAGTGTRAALPWWSADVLALPPVLDVFEQRALNRDLYVWLAAQAACQPCAPGWAAHKKPLPVVRRKWLQEACKLYVGLVEHKFLRVLAMANR